MNPWVLNRDRSIFGTDADDYVPERWLDSQERSAKMRSALSTVGARIFVTVCADHLQWGDGSRSCLGRNLAMIILRKAVTSVVRDLDIHLVNAERKWVTKNYQFVKAVDFHVIISRRTIM